MNALGLALSMYALAIVISLLAAVLIKGIVAALSLTPKPASPAQPPPRVAADPLKDDIVVITAAIYQVLGPHHIVHIARSERGRQWTAAARASHHSSHDLPHHGRH